MVSPAHHKEPKQKKRGIEMVRNEDGSKDTFILGARAHAMGDCIQLTSCFSQGFGVARTAIHIDILGKKGIDHSTALASGSREN